MNILAVLGFILIGVFIGVLISYHYFLKSKSNYNKKVQELIEKAAEEDKKLKEINFTLSLAEANYKYSDMIYNRTTKVYDAITEHYNSISCKKIDSLNG